MNRAPRTIILSDGGLPALLACAHAREAAGIKPGKHPTAMHAVLPFRCTGPQSELRRTAAAKQAEVFGLEPLDPAPPLTPPAPSFGEAESRDLLSAAYGAARCGASTIVWPIQCARADGPDLDWIARAADRAVLVSRLVALEAHEHGLPATRIETPYIDMNDDQIADLAAELDLPLRACWWWSAGPKDSQATDERTRWLAAVKRVGWETASRSGASD